MSKENVIQGIISVIIAGISAYLQIIAVPIIVLILVMVLDYITGMISAYICKQLSSRIGIVGILKKLGYLVMVCVGIVIDYIIYSGLVNMGITNFSTMIFGLLITIWLIINELISILENLSKMGVPIPSFLTKVVEKLKTNVEDKADTEK